MQTRKQYISAVLLGVLIGLTVYAVSPARITQDPPPQKELITSAPEVVSCVKNIKVLNREIRDQGTPGATVAVEVENAGELGIIAISLETTRGKETYGVLINSFEADERVAVIEPHSTATLTIEVSNLYPRVPLKIGSVTYIDGTDEGCDSSLKNMRDSKAMHEAKRAQKKGSPQ